MKILFIGDVVGRSGRDKLISTLPAIKAAHAPDVTIVNGENAAHGFGITAAICKSFFEAGVDVITTGDHVWDQTDLKPMLSQDVRVLRPHNFPAANPGKGVAEYTLANGQKILVIHLLGQIFHKENLDCPFACVDAILKSYPMPNTVNAIFVDMHAEATAEKAAMGHFLDGRVSAIIGSHTHVPTNDARILKKGSAYLTDAGMCGDYDSVIGFKPESSITRFLTKNKRIKAEVASGPATLYAQIVTTIDANGLASSIETQIF